MPVCNADHVSGTHDADPASRRVTYHHAYPGTRDADHASQREARRVFGPGVLGHGQIIRRVFRPGVLGRHEASHRADHWDSRC